MVKYLSKKGFLIIGREGSHVIMKNGLRKAVIPLHDEIARGTLLSILKQAGIARKQFIDEL